MNILFLREKLAILFSIGNYLCIGAQIRPLNTVLGSINKNESIKGIKRL